MKPTDVIVKWQKNLKINYTKAKQLLKDKKFVLINSWEKFVLFYNKQFFNKLERYISLKCIRLTLDTV